MTTDANTAASSAAPTIASSIEAGDFASFAALETARELGKTTTKDSGESSAAPPAAEPVEQATSTDVSAEPASEPGAPSTGKGKGIEKRTQQLDTEIQDLREKLKIRAELRNELARTERPPKDDAKADSSPATVAKFADYAEWLQQHPDATYEDYLDARTDHRWAEQERVKAERAHAEAARTQLTGRAQSFRDRLNAAVQAEPDFFEHISPEVATQLTPLVEFQQTHPNQPIPARVVIAEEIIGSPVGPQLMRHFSDHPQELQALLGSTDYTAIVRAIGKLEARLEAPPSSTGTPPPVPVTKAPPPPPSAGKRTAAVTDERRSAVERGDFDAFNRAETARELALARGGRR